MQPRGCYWSVRTPLQVFFVLTNGILTTTWLALRKAMHLLKSDRLTDIPLSSSVVEGHAMTMLAWRCLQSIVIELVPSDALLTSIINTNPVKMNPLLPDVCSHQYRVLLPTVMSQAGVALVQTRFHLAHMRKAILSLSCLDDYCRWKTKRLLWLCGTMVALCTRPPCIIVAENEFAERVLLALSCKSSYRQNLLLQPHNVIYFH